MSAYRLQADLLKVLEAGLVQAVDDGPSSFIDVDLRADTIAVVSSLGSAQSRSLPAPANHPLGQKAIVIAVDVTAVNTMTIDGLAGAESSYTFTERGTAIFQVSREDDTFIWKRIFPSPSTSTSSTTPLTIAVTASAGSALYMQSDGEANLADADSLTTALVIGLLSEDTTAGNVGSVVTDGTLSLPDWTLVIGTQFLTPGVVYFLSTTTGDLTATSPTTIGQVVVQVGKALSDVIMEVEIQQSVLL